MADVTDSKSVGETRVGSSPTTGTSRCILAAAFLIEKSLADAKAGEKFQFVRTGYFCKDTKYENTFNRIVTLKDGSGKKS